MCKKYDPYIVGNNVRVLREEAKISRDMLSYQIGISTCHLGKIERGEANMRYEILFALCSIFHVTPNQLLGVTELKEDVMTNKDAMVLVKVEKNGKEYILRFKEGDNNGNG